MSSIGSLEYQDAEATTELARFTKKQGQCLAYVVDSRQYDKAGPLRPSAPSPDLPSSFPCSDEAARRVTKLQAKRRSPPR